MNIQNFNSPHFKTNSYLLTLVFTDFGYFGFISIIWQMYRNLHILSSPLNIRYILYNYVPIQYVHIIVFTYISKVTVLYFIRFVL